MAKTKAAPSIDLSFIDLDSEAVAAIAELITVWIQTMPPEQLDRVHARLERIATWFEEDVLNLPPLKVPTKEA